MSALYFAQAIAAHNRRIDVYRELGLDPIPEPIAPPAPTGVYTECGTACHGEICDAGTADLDPAVEDCLGCGVSTDVNDLDAHGLCSQCVREAEDAALEILP